MTDGFMDERIGTAVRTKQELVDVLRRNRNLLRSFGIKRLGIFGSFVRDQQQADSDVDVLVEFEPGKKSFDNFIELSFLLEDLLRRRVELVTVESLSPYLRPHILGEVEDVPLAA